MSIGYQSGNVPGVGRHVEGASDANFRRAVKWAMRMLLVTILVTSAGVYWVWLKNEIDRKFIETDEINMMCQRLSEEIQVLEVEVEEMKNYKSITGTLREAGYNYVTPKRSVMIDLSGMDRRVARGGQTQSGPR